MYICQNSIVYISMKLTLDCLFYSNYIFIYVYKNGILLYSFIKKVCKLGSIHHLTFFFPTWSCLVILGPLHFHISSAIKESPEIFIGIVLSPLINVGRIDNNLMILNILIHIQCAFLHSWRVFSAMFCGFMSIYQEHILYFLLLYCTGKNVQDNAK